MELNARTFSALDDNFDLRQMLSVRTANGMRVGRLPYSQFSAEGMFVRNTFEIERLQCMALLGSGALISVDEKMVLPISAMPDGYYYLTVGFSLHITEFEQYGQTYLRPTYCCSLKTLEELDSPENTIDSVFPVIRFQVNQGQITKDKEYIPPCLILASDDRLMKYIETVVSKVKMLAEHPNMEEGDCKRTLLRIIFTLSNFTGRNTLEELMQLLRNLAMVVEYFIVLPNEKEHPALENWSQYDVEHWMRWFDTYLENAKRTLDKVVLVDNSIDYEKLKAELRQEIYAMVKDDIDAQINQARETIRTELTDQLSALVLQTIEAQKQQMHDSLHIQLLDELRQPLYDNLYHALYDALYRPPVEEEDNFMPLI